MENKFIAKELFVTTNKMRRYLDKKHLENGLYLSQARTLIYIYHNQGHSIYQSDLEKYFQIRKASVTGLIDSLNKLNLIERKESSKDKRKKKLFLTELGKLKAIIAINTLNTFESNLEKIITKEELRVLNLTLSKLNNWMVEKENNDEEMV